MGQISDIKDQLDEFLDQNDCKDAFYQMIGFYSENSIDQTIQSVMLANSIPDLIRRSFNWGDDVERGHDFWWDLSNEWEELFKD